MAPTAEQIAKLPKWAQEHIEDIKRQKDGAVRALDEYVDAQSPSPFFTEDSECTGEKPGPTQRVRFVQAYCMVVEWDGVRLRVDANKYGQQGPGIRLQWEDKSRHGRDVAFIPQSFQSARITSKDDMR